MLKVCNKCAQSKDSQAFPKDRKQCTDCVRKYARDYWHNNKENTRIKSYGRRVEARLWVYEYLKRHPCEHCGESNPIKLEFNHLKERGKKEFAIAAYLSNGCSGLFKDNKFIGIDSIVPDNHPLQIVMEEIDKCQVLCRSCHALVTAKERNTFRYRMWLLDHGGGTGN